MNEECFTCGSNGKSHTIYVCGDCFVELSNIKPILDIAIPTMVQKVLERYQERPAQDQPKGQKVTVRLVARPEDVSQEAREQLKALQENYRDPREIWEGQAATLRNYATEAVHRDNPEMHKDLIVAADSLNEIARGFEQHGRSVCWSIAAMFESAASLVAKDAAASLRDKAGKIAAQLRAGDIA